MSLKKTITILTSTFLLFGCIKNDIPYPFVVGEVLNIEVKGQTNATINRTTRTIHLEMSESVDIRQAEILVLDITPDATTTLDVSQPLDLTERVNFKVRVFRDWDWAIETTQHIERYISAQNQIGSAEFDLIKKRATFKVSEDTPLDQISLREIKLGPPSATYTPDPKTITDFTNPVEVRVQYWGVDETWTISASQSLEIVQTQSPQEVWGGFAIVRGSIIEGNPEKPTFQYRQKSNGESWKTILAEVTNLTSTSARIAGLYGNTTYEYRAELAGEYGEIMEFTTENTPTMANMGFDDWTLEGRNWFPGYQTTDNFWSTGNEGVTLALAGGHDSNTFPTDDAIKGKAACLRTIRVNVTNIAAGSIFTGTFNLNVLNPTRSVRFGQPYTGRPTRIRFWYKYLPKAIDVASNANASMLGQMDNAEVYVYLGTWSNTLLSTDLNRENTAGAVAFGAFSTNKTVDTYQKQEITLNYMDRTTIPSQIIFVATPSKFGESFTGGIGSTLYIDEIEFLFD